MRFQLTQRFWLLKESKQVQYSSAQTFDLNNIFLNTDFIKPKN